MQKHNSNCLSIFSLVVATLQEIIHFTAVFAFQYYFVFTETSVCLCLCPCVSFSLFLSLCLRLFLGLSVLSQPLSVCLSVCLSSLTPSPTLSLFFSRTRARARLPPVCFITKNALSAVNRETVHRALIRPTQVYQPFP